MQSLYSTILFVSFPMTGKGMVFFPLTSESLLHSLKFLSFKIPFKKLIFICLLLIPKLYSEVGLLTNYIPSLKISLAESGAN